MALLSQAKALALATVHAHLQQLQPHSVCNRDSSADVAGIEAERVELEQEANDKDEDVVTLSLSFYIAFLCYCWLYIVLNESCAIEVLLHG